VRLALSPLAGIAWNPENMDQQSVTAELQDTLDDVSLTAIRQFEDWFSRGEMRARHHDGDEQPPAPFASVFEQLDVPLLFLNGTLDPWAPPAQLESIWERIPSARKERIALAGFGHNDLRMGNLAAAEVFPRIARFLVQTGSITARP